MYFLHESPGFNRSSQSAQPSRPAAGLPTGAVNSRGRNPATRNQSRQRFRFQARGAHLTYKTHIPFADIHTLLNEVGKVGGTVQPLVWYSFVHEDGTDDPSNPYAHTHVAWEWQKKIDKSNPRLFDIRTSAEETLHPHIQLFENDSHKCRIYDEYHAKSPVALEQSECSPSTSLPLIEQIVRARTLHEACEIAGVEIKSVSDVKLLRDDRPAPEPYTHLYPETEWLLDHGFRHCCYIWGPTGTGKTQWALHHFRQPLLVSTRDTLRNFRGDQHDGIVFDDIDFTKWEREELIHLFDWDTDRTIRCRYSDALIPRFTKKIVTSNRPFDVNFHMDADIGAIRRRFDRIIHASGPTFAEAPPSFEVPTLQAFVSTFHHDDPQQELIDDLPDNEFFLSQMSWPSDSE